MQLSDAIDLGVFLTEFGNETDRGLALVGPAVIDQKLGKTLEAFFRDEVSAERLLASNTRGPLSSLSARTDAALALGLIEQSEYDEISLIRKIRNKFAHSGHGITFKTPEITSLCLKLKSELPHMEDGQRPTARMRFTNAVTITYLRLYYRPEWVARERRVSKVWISPLELQWQPIRLGAAPPKDAGVMVVTLLKEKGAPAKTGMHLAIPAPRAPWEFGQTAGLAL